MPVPQELMDKVNGDLKSGALPQDIVHSIVNGTKYPDLAAKMKADLDGGMGYDAVFQRLQASEVVKAPGIIDRAREFVSGMIPHNVGEPVPAPVPVNPLAVAPAVLPPSNNGAMLAKLQALRGAPVGPGMPANVAEVRPTGMTDAGMEILPAAGAAIRNTPAAVMSGAGGLVQAIGETGQQVFGENDILSKLLAESGKHVYQEQTTDLEKNTPQDFTEGQKHLYSALLSAGSSLAMLPLGMANAGLPLLAMGAQSGGRTFGELSEAGVPFSRKLPAAAGDTAVEIGTELVPLNILTREGLPFVKRLVGGLISEEIGETTATTLQTALDMWARNPGVTWGEYKKQVIPAIKDTLIQTPIAAGAQTGIAHPFFRAKTAPEQGPAINGPAALDPEAPVPDKGSGMGLKTPEIKPQETVTKSNALPPVQGSIETVEQGGKYAGPERRVDDVLRDRWRTLSPEEQFQEHVTAHTDRKTGLLNEAGWNAAPRKKYQAYIDLDDLGLVNGIMGHPKGDEFLQKFGQALKELDIDGARKSGDEHLAQHDDSAILESKLAELRRRMEAETLTTDKNAGDEIELGKPGAPGSAKIRLNQDSTITKKGIGFSYGIGESEAAADNALYADKSRRSGANLRGLRGLGRNFSQVPRGERAGDIREQPRAAEVTPPVKESPAPVPTPEPTAPIEKPKSKLQALADEIDQKYEAVKSAIKSLFPNATFERAPFGRDIAVRVEDDGTIRVQASSDLLERISKKFPGQEETVLKLMVGEEIIHSSQATILGNGYHEKNAETWKNAPREIKNLVREVYGDASLYDPVTGKSQEMNDGKWGAELIRMAAQAKESGTLTESVHKKRGDAARKAVPQLLAWANQQEGIVRSAIFDVTSTSEHATKPSVPAVPALSGPVSSHRLKDVVASRSLPVGFGEERQAALNAIYGEHRRAVVEKLKTERPESVPGIKDYNDLMAQHMPENPEGRTFTNDEREELGGYAKSILSGTSENYTAQVKDGLGESTGEVVKSDRSWSTRKSMNPWLGESDPLPAAQVLKSAADGVWPEKNSVEQWAIIYKALDYTKEQAGEFAPSAEAGTTYQPQKYAKMGEKPQGEMARKLAEAKRQDEEFLTDIEQNYQDVTKKSVNPKGEGKQPWEMTRHEWERERESARPNVVQSNYTKGSGSQAVSKLNRVEELTYGVTDAASKKLKDAAEGKIKLTPAEVEALTERINTRVTHRDVVQKALAEGQPVPADVLGHYPELQELHGFGSAMTKPLRWLFGINDKGQAKWIERFFDRMGERISPTFKTEVGKIARVAHFYVEEHPSVEPLFLRNLARAEARHRDGRSIFAEDPDNNYAGVQPLLDLKNPGVIGKLLGKNDEIRALSDILVAGDKAKRRYSADDLRKDFKATDRVVSAYTATRDMIERLEALEIERGKEIALVPYEENAALHDKLSRVMDDLMETKDVKDREKYMSKLFHEQASVLDAETQRALTRVRENVEGIHARLGVFEDNPGYLPRVRDEGAYHVRAIQHVLSQDEAGQIKGAIFYGRKARKYDGYTKDQLKEKFNITGKVADAYKEAMERVADDPVLSRSGASEVEVHKAVGKIVDAVAMREVWMAPAGTEGAAKDLREEARKNPEKFFPHNYDPKGKYEFPDPVENKKLPEEVYQDVGNPAAREAFIERAVRMAEARGSISVQDAEAISDMILQAGKEEALKRAGGRSYLKRSENLIEGYKTDDLDKVIIEHVTGMVGYLNKGLYSIRALRDLEQVKKPQEQRWAHVYYKNSLKNSTTVDSAIAHAKGAAVFYRLGGVVKTALQNSFQQFLTGRAEMARFTRDNILLQAKMDTISGHLTEFDRKVIEDGLESGLTDAQYMRDIAGASERGPERGFSKLVDVSMKGFGLVETELNRKPALLAAMRLFTGAKNGKGAYYGTDLDGKPYRMSYDEAMQKAQEFVRSTHYEISKANEPEIVQTVGGALKGAYTFQSFTANNLNWIFNRARHGEVRALGRYMLALWVLGGIAAIPFYDELDGLLIKMFGLPMKHKIRGMIEDYLKHMGLEDSPTLEEIILHGLPSVAGVNMSKSVQLNTPLPIAILIDQDKSVEEKASGAIGGLVISGGRAISAASRGDFGRAAELASPNAVGNILAAMRLYREGATTLRGRPITDEGGQQIKYSAGEAAGKALGFTPSRVARYTEMNRTKYLLAEHWGDKRQGLLDRYRTSKNDAKARARVVEDIEDFNRELTESDAKGIVPKITPESKINAIMNKPDPMGNRWKREYLGQ